jgi:MoaA/NifB/PqqE/SkfB family radical SAM enzyme
MRNNMTPSLKGIAKQISPPFLWIFLKEIKKIFNKRYYRGGGGKQLAACHFFEPFVSHSGDVFPCCRVWNDPKKKIGHLTDPDIITKMKEFDIFCQCDTAILKKWEGENIGCVYIETALACNASCAMCCVHAPSWRGTYDLYGDLTRFISQLCVSKISVQGGECLIQPRTMQWLDAVRIENPNIKIHLITNGNISTAIYGQVKRIFTSMTVSIVGFQDATYTKIMGINFTQTKLFIKMVCAETNIPLSLKYLITPINIHEIDLFMDWAVEQESDSIQLIEASPLIDAIHLGNSIPFWETIIDRAGQALQASLKRHITTLNKRGCKVICSRFVVDYLGITPAFIEKIGLLTYTQYS